MTIQLSPKVDACKSNIEIIWTLIFEWYVVRSGSKNGHQNGLMCLKEIGLRTRNMLIILGSIVNMIGGDVCDHLMSMRFFTVII